MCGKLSWWSEKEGGVGANLEIVFIMPFFQRFSIASRAEILSAISKFSENKVARVLAIPNIETGVAQLYRNKADEIIFRLELSVIES